MPRSRTTDRRHGVNIIGLDNGAGLSVDARLLRDTLDAAGYQSTWIRGLRPSKWAMRFAARPVLRRLVPRQDANIFLEYIHPGWLPLARINVLIPNPEWFLEESYAYLDAVDVVLCKTSAAERAFRALGKRTRWIGFTAGDRGGEALAVSSAPLRALHLAGRSEHKGTRQTIDAWARHPEWPELTVVQRPLDKGSVLYAPALPNVRYWSQRLPDEAIRALQRGHGVHVLPSEVEGYGQALVEGMSAGSVVITTDAPPMNELVTAERGVVVRAEDGEAIRLGHRYKVVGSALEAALAEVFAWPPERRERIGAAARAWYVENDQRFRSDFPRLLAALLADTPRADTVPVSR